MVPSSLASVKNALRTKDVYVNRVHPGADQSVRSMNITLAAYITENDAAVVVLVLQKPNDAEQTRGTVRRSGHNSQLGGSAAGAGKDQQSVTGIRTLRPNVRNINRVD